MAALDTRYLTEEGPVAILKTSEGYISIALHPGEAPMSVYSFVSLAKGNYYNSSIFHTVVPHVFVQAGNREEKKSDLRTRVEHKLGETYKERSEVSPTRGDVMLVNFGLDKREYQFLITAAEHLPELRGKYPRLGTVISGMDVVEKIAKSESNVLAVSIARIEKILIK